MLSNRLFVSTRTRVLEPELMENPGLERGAHFLALRELGEINQLSLTARRIGQEIRRIHPDSAAEIRVLDIACGGGDVAVALERRLARSGRRGRVDGCDIHPRALEFARIQARAGSTKGRFFSLDVLRDGLPGDYEFLVCSLFFHHLSSAEVVELLANMAAAARVGLVVSDLRRCRTGFLLAKSATRLLTGSPVVRADSLTSVRASFTPSEMAALASRAGLKGYELKRTWPCRWLFSWSRHASRN